MTAPYEYLSPVSGKEAKSKISAGVQKTDSFNAFSNDMNMIHL